jgi:hypothetical protein
MRLLHELKRRIVVRVAIAQGAAAFVVLQLADLVLGPRAREYEHHLRDYLRVLDADPDLAPAIIEGIEHPRQRERAIRLVEGIDGAGRLFPLLQARDQTIRELEGNPLYLDLSVHDFSRDDLRFQAMLVRRGAEP